MSVCRSLARSLAVCLCRQKRRRSDLTKDFLGRRQRESEGRRSRIDWRQLFRSGGWRGWREGEEFEGHAILAPPCLESACLRAIVAMEEIREECASLFLQLRRRFRPQIWAIRLHFQALLFAPSPPRRAPSPPPAVGNPQKRRARRKRELTQPNPRSTR